MAWWAIVSHRDGFRISEELSQLTDSFALIRASWKLQLKAEEEKKIKHKKKFFTPCDVEMKNCEEANREKEQKIWTRIVIVCGNSRILRKYYEKNNFSISGFKRRFPDHFLLAVLFIGARMSPSLASGLFLSSFKRIFIAEQQMRKENKKIDEKMKMKIL